MESEFDFCARRAAEEFVAANRAATAEERKTHRQLAEQYADVVRELIQRHNDGIAMAPGDMPSETVRDDDQDAQAA